MGASNVADSLTLNIWLEYVYIFGDTLVGQQPVVCLSGDGN